MLSMASQRHKVQDIPWLLAQCGNRDENTFGELQTPVTLRTKTAFAPQDRHNMFAHQPKQSDRLPYSGAKLLCHQEGERRRQRKFTLLIQNEEPDHPMPGIRNCCVPHAYPVTFPAD